MITKCFHEKTNSTSGGMIGHKILISNFSRLIFQWETKVNFRYFALKTLFQALYLEIKLMKYRIKTLKSQLLKKLWIEIYEILDLSSSYQTKKNST